MQAQYPTLQRKSKIICNDKFAETDPNQEGSHYDDNMDIPDPQRLRDLKLYNYFIVLPDDPLRGKWDVLITL